MDHIYHAKDMFLKNIVSAFAHDSLRWMGIEHTDVVGVMPTEFTTVDIRKDMLDYVFTLADDSLLHLEFQSSTEKTLHRFLLYDTLLSQHTNRMIRTVVLYTNQITHTSDQLDMGSAQYHVENIYLAKKEADEILARIQNHLTSGIFTLEDRFDLAFALHMHRSRSLEEMIHQSISLIEQIHDPNEPSYVAAIFVELGTHWLDDDHKKQIRKWVERVDIVKEIVEEAVEETRIKALREGIQVGKQEGRQEGRQEERLELARKLLAEGEPVARIARLTGLAPTIVQELSTNH
jgi:predicted transposase YdaD